MRPSVEGYYSLGYWRDEERDRNSLVKGWLTLTCGLEPVAEADRIEVALELL